MKLYRLMASILCMALLMVLCPPAICSAEIIPFAENGNVVQAWLNFSGNKIDVGGKVTKLEAGCTAKTTVYVQAKSGSSWITKASGSGSREASASYTCLLYTSGLFLLLFGLLSGALAYVLQVCMAVWGTFLQKRRIRNFLPAALLFPVYIMTWIPVNIMCLFHPKTSWEPIKHERAIPLERMEEGEKIDASQG